MTGELVERAIDMGYLSGGETVSITVTSADADWQAREEQAAREDLEERYGETIVIQIGPADEEPPATEVVIPVTPPEPEPTPEPSPEQADPPVVPDDTDYGPNADGVTDYEDRDDDRNTDDDRWEDDEDDDESDWDDDDNDDGGDDGDRDDDD